MITNKKLIDIINNKQLVVKRLGFEVTRRCNYKCRMCSQGKAQPVELDPRVPQTVLEQFPVANISMSLAVKRC